MLSKRHVLEMEKTKVLGIIKLEIFIFSYFLCDSVFRNVPKFTTWYKYFNCNDYLKA